MSENGPAPGAEAAAKPADKGDDLDSVRAAMVDAATVSSGLWLSYLFALFYLLVAAGAVTHRDLFFETPVRLPFLGVDLPLKGFFWLGPTLFVIVHAYVLLHFVLLSGKIAAYDATLRAQVADLELRTRLRRQLPSNIFVQFLAGPVEVRHGLVGVLLEVIAWISLVIGPVILLVFFQLQFLPYHEAWITWWQRIAVLVDVVLLWALWPAVVREADPDRAATTLFAWRQRRVAAFRRRMGWMQEPPYVAAPPSGGIASRGIRWSTALVLGGITVVSLSMVFAIATFPGEWLNSFSVPLRKTLVESDVDFSSGRRKSWWSNTLVLPGLDAIDRSKFDSDAKIAAARETMSLRKRDLRGAVLIGAILQKVDLSAVNLQDAQLQGVDLRGAKLECGNLPRDVHLQSADFQNPDSRCAELQGSNFDGAQLKEAILTGAQLKGASFDSAQMQGASLNDAALRGARLDRAQLQGASFNYAQLQGASLTSAKLQGASLTLAKLQGARLDGAQLQGARLNGAELQGASFNYARLQGASLGGAELEGASFNYARLQGASLGGAQLQGALLDNAQLQAASLDYAQLQAASLRSAQLQSTSFNYAQLQGASLVHAQLQGASLFHAQLQGASLDYAELQGASLDSANLNSTSLVHVSVWRTSNRFLDIQNARVELTTLDSKSCTEPVDQICGRSTLDQRRLIDLVESEVPGGELKDAALTRIQKWLDPGVALPDDQIWAQTWVASAKSRPVQAAYEAALAQQWARIGCQADAAPYVFHGLARSIRYRFSRGSKELPALAAKFLDGGCAGAEGLAAADRWNLQKLRDEGGSKPAASAHQP